MSEPLTHIGFKVVSTVLGLLTIGQLNNISKNQVHIYRRLGDINENLVINYNKLNHISAKLDRE